MPLGLWWESVQGAGIDNCHDPFWSQHLWTLLEPFQESEGVVDRSAHVGSKLNGKQDGAC